MHAARRRYRPALVTGTLLGLLVCLVFVLGAAAQDTGSGSPHTSSASHSDGNTSINGTVAAGIIISPTQLEVWEPDSSDTFTAALTSQPTSFVILPVTASNAQCTVSPSSVTWIKSDWQRVFVITVTAKNDDLEDGDQICTIDTGPATSVDTNYSGVDPEDVEVVVHDDDYRERIYLPGILRTWSAIPTEIEPNDTPAQANVQVASGVTYYGSFPSESDVNDYFYIVLDTAHTVEGWLTNIPADRNYDLVLRYDFAPYEVVPSGYSGNLGNADEYFLTGTLAPGRYLIQVFHREEPRLGSTQSYHLRVVYE